MYIRVITKLPNSEQSYKGKVKTHIFRFIFGYPDMHRTPMPPLPVKTRNNSRTGKGVKSKFELRCYF